MNYLISLSHLHVSGYYLMNGQSATNAIPMTTLQKTIIATFTVAIGVGIYQATQAYLLRAQIGDLQQQLTTSSEQAKQAALAPFRTKVTLLEAQNEELSRRIAQANADKARLQTEREQAMRSAALYKDLVDQANSKDVNPTNEYPTQRHVWAAFGRLGRLGALSKENDNNLSAQEKSALEAAKTKALEDLPNLVKAAKQYDAAKSSQTDPQWDDVVDEVGCLLYGALNLDGQQFNQLSGVMQKLSQQAKQNGLSKVTPAAEATEAAKQLMEQFKAETQALLTPEQSRVFAEVVTHLLIEPGRISYNFNF